MSKSTSSDHADNIHFWLLKAGDNSVYHSLTHTFSVPIISGEILEEWKTTVTPLFKDGDITKVGYYRPISELPVVM